MAWLAAGELSSRPVAAAYRPADRLPAAIIESFEPSVLLAPVSLSLSVPSSIPLEVEGTFSFSFSGNEINQ